MAAQSGDVAVLYVEADPERADRTVTLLEDATAELSVTAVSTAQQALDRLQTDTVDCILSAYTLPEIDGLQFLQAVRAEYPNLPFILYTTAVSGDIVSAAVSADVSDHLDKPQQPSGYRELADRIVSIVARERARQADSSDHEQARRVLEASPDAIVVSVDREIVYANPAATDLFDTQEAALLGRDPVELVDTPPTLWVPDGEQSVDRDLTRHRGSLSRPDGRLDVELTTNSLEWRGQSGVVAVLRDVSGPPDHETNAEHVGAHLQGIVNSVSAVIFLKDADGRYLLMNRHCRELFGIDESTNVVGLTDEELFDDAVAAHLGAEDDRVFAQGEVVEVEATVPTTEGERTLLTKKTPLFDDGEQYALCAVATDITQQRERQHALGERMKELSAVHRAVDRFQSTDKPVADRLDAFVTALPDSFQYPDRTAVRLTYGEESVVTAEFDPDLPMIDAVGETQAGPTVHIEVVCRPPEGTADPFLPEERRVLDTLASLVAGHLDRQAYIENLQRYETTLRALGDPVYALDPSGTFTFVNDALLEQTGYERGELLGAHADRVLTEGGLERGQAVIRQLLTSDQQSAKWDLEITTADGERIPTENHVALLPFDESGFRGTAGVLRDITERTERERELSRRKDMLVRTEQMADVGGWELDTDTGEVYWSEGTRKILEVPYGFDPTPESVFEYYHPDDHERVQNAVVRCRETGEPFDLECRVITAEGRERQVQIRGERVTTDNSETIRGTVHDVTEIRKNEQQLSVLNRVLRHNLRNNLNVVTANAELVRDHIEQLRSNTTGMDAATATQDAVEQFPFEDVLDNVDQLDAKAWELLAIADKSRELAGVVGQTDSTETADIESLLTDLVSEYRTEYTNATIDLDTIPATADTNPESVYLAVEELLENALQHAGSEPTVEISVTRPDPNRVEIAIADDGPGIPDIERRTLEADVETDLRHSSGFGLWTVDWLLGRVGGSVTIESTDSGTVVRVDLPAA
ncbi:PAS domain S-box protein [Halovenus halobia]|uniref:PAS domain S-box protein n=1 Tax=Halovenus halobia TaxID=3396622 RepID=UPI003F569381